MAEREPFAPRVRVDALRPGVWFTAAYGGHWTYVRVDGALSGAHHATGSGGEQTCFAGCAEVELGWNEVGWLQRR